MKTSFLSAGLLLTGLMAAGCAPIPPPATPAALPQAQVSIQHDTTPALPAAILQDEPSEAAPPASTPIPQDVAEIALDIYGERLIEWIRIPALRIQAPVVPVGWSPADDPDTAATEWQSPEAAVGWAVSSALPGDAGGNILLYGHNNIHSSVFQHLADLQPGDEVRLATGQQEWLYRVSEVHILPVADDKDSSGLTERFLRSGAVPHLLLVSCWPPQDNTHRVIVVAQSAAE